MIILPYGPDPLMADKSIPFSAAIVFAKGLAKILVPVPELVDLIDVSLCEFYWTGVDTYELLFEEAALLIYDELKFWNLLTSSLFLTTTATYWPTGKTILLGANIFAKYPFSVA